MYCRKCGAELPQDAIFCSKCGAETGAGAEPKEKKLYKSERNKMLCGVCAGIADYFKIDPTLVRLGLVVFSAMGGAGLLAYIVLAIVLPTEPQASINEPKAEFKEAPQEESKDEQETADK